MLIRTVSGKLFDLPLANIVYMQKNQRYSVLTDVVYTQGKAILQLTCVVPIDVLQDVIDKVKSINDIQEKMKENMKLLELTLL